MVYYLDSFLYKFKFLKNKKKLFGSWQEKKNYLTFLSLENNLGWCPIYWYTIYDVNHLIFYVIQNAI